MIILQGVTHDNHFDAIKGVFAIEEPERVIISVAFANEAGVALVEEWLSNLNSVTRLIIGIRNGITSAQALRRCLSTDCELFVVDTGSRSTIFHPKVYFARNSARAHLIIGSANLTYGGLISNIEASILLTFQLDNENHRQLADELERKLDQLVENFEEHVVRVDEDDMIENLLNDGRITDEVAKPPPAPTGFSSGPNTNHIPRMPLNVRHVARVQRRLGTSSDEEGDYPATNVNRPTLVWQSSRLTRRDLNIPTSPNTAPTGSMLFKKGASDIAHQIYFRQQVFDKLNWRPDPGTQGKELAEAVFQIIIGMIDFGEYNLTVTHDTRTNTRSFEQSQPMSALRWGEIKPIIAREDLLDRTLYLYRAGEHNFVIEID